MKNLSFLNLIRVNSALRKEKVSLCFLFGPAARGGRYVEPKVDVAILFDKSVKKESFLKREGKLISFFSRLFSGREINLINLAIASPLYRQSAIIEGQLIYVRNEDDRIFFQVGALRLYEEYRHLSEIYNPVLEEKIKNV